MPKLVRLNLCLSEGPDAVLASFYSDGKVSAYNAGDPGLILGLGRSPGEGQGYPLQSVHGILQARILEWVAMPSSRGSSQPRAPGSPVPGILQARTLEWVAISFSNAGK